MVDDNGGGGASRSTEPAAGTSAATDVSLREHMAALIGALDRHVTSDLAALRRETHAANENAQRAIEVAAHEAAERLAAHNGLIDQMQAQQSTFATRDALEDFKEAIAQRMGRVERFQATLTGGLLLIGFIGVANLIKVWTG